MSRLELELNKTKLKYDLKEIDMVCKFKIALLTTASVFSTLWFFIFSHISN